MRPRPSVLVALGVVTAVALAEQIVLTRLFSAVLPYHFGFLAISLSMVGTGAAALFLFLRPRQCPEEDPGPFFARWAALLSVTLTLVPMGLARLDLGGRPLGVDFALRFGLACIFGALPAFAAGVVVAGTIARYSASIGVVYAADLAGAGAGALGVVPLLALLPAPALLVLLGAVAAAIACVFAVPRSALRRTSGVLFATSVALSAFGGDTPLLYLEPGYGQAPEARTVAEHWTPLGRHLGIVVGDRDHKAYLFYDRVYAPIPAVAHHAAPDYRTLRTGPASIGFAMAEHGNALIIGGGGGRDIYNALSSGVERVDVIELLDGNRRVVDEDLGAYSGSPYSRPGVHTVVADGKSELASRHELYDQIHIGFTDTLSANAAQGFALSENGLYTVEAFEQYFDHLKPRGILNVSRLLKLVGDEALRVTVLTLAALERRGVADPFAHVIVVMGDDILGPPTGTVLARLEPFTPEEIARIRKLAAERARGLLLVPGGPNQREWRDLARAPSLTAFCRAYHQDVCPPTDDRPFFFDMGRLGDLGELGSGYLYASPISVLLLSIAILAVLSAAGLVAPVALSPRARRPSLRVIAFFGAIGAGFLLLEIVLMQRLTLFLGYPTYALSVVLFALLVSSGIGALSSARLERNPYGLGGIVAVAVVLIASSAFVLPNVLSACIGLPLVVRGLVAVSLIAPFGACLGAVMPLGLSRLAGERPENVPYAWGVNGITSVLASVAGTFISVKGGFTVLSLVASAAYGVALVTLPRERALPRH